LEDESFEDFVISMVDFKLNILFKYKLSLNLIIKPTYLITSLVNGL